MKKFLAFIIIIFVIFVLLYRNGINSPNENIFGEKDFVIKKGERVKVITDNLVSQGFLERPIWFKMYIWFHGYKTKLVDGSYELRTDLTVKQLVEALMTQQQNKEKEITIVEGWTQSEIDKYLSAEMAFEQGDLIKYSKNFNRKDWSFLTDKPKDASLEGYLYPDTYRVYKQTELDAVVARMLNNFDAKLTEDLRDEIKKQKKTIFEIVTLASIVEKEMFGYENRRVVAGIFYNRLAVGMPLQSDVTVNYITKKGMVRPTIADTKINNPYNTYVNKGLPPGPVCNPSIEAIKAVIYAADTDFLYFLTSENGQIIFSKTYEEHLRNINKHLH